MLAKVARKLFLTQALVFFVVITCFSATVYLTQLHAIQSEERERLSTIVDTVIDSVEHDTDKNGLPDIFEDVQTSQSSADFASMTLQWFSAEGKKLAERGRVGIDLPFDSKQVFQLQTSPQRALVLTRAAIWNGNFVGYVRGAISLQDFDSDNENILRAIVYGAAAAFFTSTCLIVLVVRQSLDPIQKNIVQLEQFSANASHELKSPLMAIKTNATVALKYADGMRPRDQEKFVAILNATEQMIATTSDLLALAEAERTSVSAQSVDLGLVLEDVCQTMSLSATEKNIAIKCTQSNGSHLLVPTSSEDTRIVLSNVLENAVRYSSPGSEINVSLARHGVRAKLVIQDKGIGISENDLPHIFDRFWRADSARQHNAGGSGLGLSIAEAIMRKYGGTIQVESRLAEGTTATIWFPLHS